MHKSHELWLPSGYDSQMTNADRETHEQLAHTSLDDFVAGMPEPSAMVLANGQEVRYVDLPGEDDPNRAVVVNLPFGNAYTPAMHIRIKTMQRFLDPSPRVLVFPNNTVGDKYYELKGLDLQFPLISLSKKILETTAKAGVGQLNIVGDSQGASVGGAMLSEAGDDFDLGAGHSLREPVSKRGKLALKIAFMKSGLKLNKAINDSAIPALSEAQYSRGGSDNARQLFMFTKVAKDAGLPANVALHRALSIDRFARGIADVEPEAQRKINIVRMAASYICGRELDDELERYGFKGSLTVVDSYGHEGSDNVVLAALLTREHLAADQSAQ